MQRRHVPVLIHPLQWSFYALVLLLPEFWLSLSHPWWRLPVGIAVNAVDYMVLSWCVCTLFAVFGRLRHWIETFLHIAMHMLVVLFSVGNLLLLMLFHRHWDAFTLQLVRETNRREAVEFIKVYLCDFRSVLMGIAVLLVVVCYVWLVRRTKVVRCLPQKPLLKWTMLACVAAVLSQACFFTGDAEENYRRAAGLPVKCNALFVLHQSVLQMKGFEDENNLCAQTLRQYEEKDSCESDLQYLVLVIGESFNRHHSSLYGYALPTNPLLGKLRDEGSLFVFDDVIAPINNTTLCFKQFLSMASVTDTLAWNEAPLFPAIMKRVGWNVVYYSNQFSDGEELKEWNASMGFVNHPRIAPYLFHHRNHRTYTYDMELVDDYIRHRDELEADNRNLIIFHLLGQHVSFNRRYPEDEGCFTGADINRPDLSDSQREVIAGYDNATLYNDKVVDRIVRMFEHGNTVVIYFPDHGEEVYDYRNQVGRSDLVADSAPETLRNQLDIPFMIYLSPQYARQHPDLPGRIGPACRKPFMTDDVSHLMLDMAGIRSRWLDVEKSPLSPSYPTERHRHLMLTGLDYDSLMQ